MVSKIPSKHDIKSMVEYIEQDGWEKVEEIEAKSQEEFEIEKTRIRDTEILKLSNFFNRQEEKLTRTLKAEHSRSKLRSKIKYLDAQKNILIEIHQKAREALNNCANDASQQNRYRRIMEDLILQSALKLLEKNAFIQVRRKDQTLLKEILSNAENNFEEVTKQKISIKLDETPLPDSCGGGIILRDERKRILIDNTLDTRLQLVIGNLNSPFMPMFRRMIFGSAGKKFKIDFVND